MAKKILSLTTLLFAVALAQQASPDINEAGYDITIEVPDEDGVLHEVDVAVTPSEDENSATLEWWVDGEHGGSIEAGISEEQEEIGWGAKWQTDTDPSWDGEAGEIITPLPNGYVATGGVEIPNEEISIIFGDSQKVDFDEDGSLTSTEKFGAADAEGYLTYDATTKFTPPAIQAFAEPTKIDVEYIPDGESGKIEWTVEGEESGSFQYGVEEDADSTSVEASWDLGDSGYSGSFAETMVETEDGYDSSGDLEVPEEEVSINWVNSDTYTDNEDGSYTIDKVVSVEGTEGSLDYSSETTFGTWESLQENTVQASSLTHFVMPKQVSLHAKPVGVYEEVSQQESSQEVIPITHEPVPSQVTLHNKPLSAIEPVTEPITEPVSEPVTEPVSEPVTEPADEPINEPADEPITEPVSEPVTEPADEPINEPADELITEPVSEPVTEPADEPINEPADEPITEPVSEPVTEPADEPINEPGDEPITEPVSEPVTEPADEPITEPVSEPVTEPANEPINEPAGEPITEPADEPVTEPTNDQPEFLSEESQNNRVIMHNKPIEALPQTPVVPTPLSGKNLNACGKDCDKVCKSEAGCLEKCLKSFCNEPESSSWLLWCGAAIVVLAVGYFVYKKLMVPKVKRIQLYSDELQAEYSRI